MFVSTTFQSHRLQDSWDVGRGGGAEGLCVKAYLCVSRRACVGGGQVCLGMRGGVGELVLVFMV